MQGPSGEWRHKAFISYSRTDRELAAAIQDGLEQLTKPYLRRRLFDVFLDTADIPSGGSLPGWLDEALTRSEFLILVASPASAERYWVNVELGRWLEERGTDHVIIALAGGELVWEQDPAAAARPGWARDGDLVLPPALRDKFSAQPVWVDFRELVEQARDRSPGAASRLTLDDAAFKLNIARLQAPLRGPDVKPSDIVGEDLALWRASKRRRRRAIAALITLTVASVLGGAIAVLFAQRSAAQERTALSRQLASQSAETSGVPLDLGLLLSIEGYRTDQTNEALGGLIKAADRADDVERILHGHDRPLRSVALDPDGSLMASAAVGGSLTLWDGESFEQIGEPLLPTTQDVADPGLRSLAFSPAEPLLAAGGFDGRIRLWDTSDPDNARERPALQPDPESGRSIVALAFDPHGSSLVSAGGVAVDGSCSTGEGSSVFVSDIATGGAELLGSVQGCVSSLAFSPTEPVVASANSDGTVVLWDVAKRTVRATFGAHGDWVTSVAFSPDGTRLATAGRDAVVKVWDVRDLTQPTPQPITSFRGHGAVVRTVAFSPDGSTVASGDRDGQIMVWDPNTGRAVHELSASHAGEVWSVAFHPTRPLLASASADQTIAIWTLDGGRAPTTLVAAGKVRALLYDAEQSVMVAAGSRQITDAEGGGQGGIVWSPISRAGPPEGRVVEQTVFALALDATTGVLASGDADGTVTFWDSATRVPLSSLENLDVERCGSPVTPLDAVYSLAFDPSRSMLAVGFKSGTIVLMEAPFDADGAARCSTVEGVVWDLEFSPDGKRLAASNGDARVLLWDIETDERTPIVAAAETVTSIAFRPPGDLLAIGDNAGGIVLYDLNTNALVGQSLKGHGSAVKGLRFHPGGAILASASLDGAVVLWDIATRLPLTGRLTGYDDATAHPLLTVEWLANGAALASGGTGGAVLWDFRPATLRTRVCAAANRNLSALEWTAFVGSDREYRRSCDDRPPGVGAG